MAVFADLDLDRDLDLTKTLHVSSFVWDGPAVWPNTWTHRQIYYRTRFESRFQDWCGSGTRIAAKI